MTGRGLVEQMAHMAVVGFDPIAYLEGDIITRTLMEQAAARAIEIMDQRDQNLANRITNNIGKMFK